jgi:6-phosphogluconolactonase (cycloisomerase 2 family)
LANIVGLDSVTTTDRGESRSRQAELADNRVQESLVASLAREFHVVSSRSVCRRGMPHPVMIGIHLPDSGRDPSLTLNRGDGWMKNLYGGRYAGACLLGLIGTCFAGGAVDAQETAVGKLEYLDAVTSEGLDMVTSVECSPDGKFLYASAWQAATITVCSRDPDSGKLKIIQEIKDPDLRGATATRLSSDGKYAVASAFSSKTAVLFGRDAETGKLKRLDVARNGQQGVLGLEWAIDATFSPDSKFVYLIDSRGPSREFGVAAGSVTVFRITEDERLEFVETGGDSDFANARGIACRPDGKTILVTSTDAATLVVLNRHPDSGKTTTRQVLRDGQGGVRGLSGAMGIAISADGQFAYVASGRFRGDDAIGVYQFDDLNELLLIQELINGDGTLTGFDGGNEIAISPDGANVYAVATVSNSLACFRRNPQNGRLEFQESISDQRGALTGAAGICLSPDGQFVYVAAEESGTVSVFRRQTVPR